MATKMNFQPTTIPDSLTKNTAQSDDDSDEDLEALRLAALQSRKSSKNNSSLSFGNNYQTHTKYQWNGMQSRNWNGKVHKWRQRPSNLIVINTLPSEKPKTEVAESLLSLALPQNRYARITPERVLVKNSENNGPKKFSRLESNSDDSDYDDSSSSESEKSVEDEDKSPKKSEESCDDVDETEESKGDALLLAEDGGEFESLGAEEEVSACPKDRLACEELLESKNRDPKRGHSPVGSNSSKENSVRSPCKANRSSAVAAPTSRREKFESHRDRTNASVRCLVPSKSSEPKDTRPKSLNRRTVIVSAKEEDRSKKCEELLNCDPRTDLRLILKSKRGLAENSDEDRETRKRSPTPDSPVVFRSVLSVVKVKNMQRQDDETEQYSRRKDRKRKRSPRDDSPNMKISKMFDADGRATGHSKSNVHMRLGTPSKPRKGKSDKRNERPASQPSAKTGKGKTSSRKSSTHKDSRNSGNLTAQC